jgi:hypothetical protein
VKKWLIGLALVALTLVVPPVSWAHEGHAHRVMGTISSIEGNQITIKATDGKMAIVMLDAKTKITQGKNKIDASALKVGERVVAVGPEDKNKMIVATTVQLGTAPAAPASASAAAASPSASPPKK